QVGRSNAMAKKKITIQKGSGARPGAGAGPIVRLPEDAITVDRTPPIWERYEEKPLLDIVEVADYLELSAQTVVELLVTGQFPEPLMYDGKRRWSIAAIADWAKAWPEKKRRLDREWGLPLEDQPADRSG